MDKPNFMHLNEIRTSVSCRHLTFLTPSFRNE